MSFCLSSRSLFPESHSFFPWVSVSQCSHLIQLQQAPRAHPLNQSAYQSAAYFPTRYFSGEFWSINYLLQRGLYLEAVGRFITAQWLVSKAVSLWEEIKRSREESQKENTSWVRLAGRWWLSNAWFLFSVKSGCIPLLVLWNSPLPKNSYLNLD